MSNVTQRHWSVQRWALRVACLLVLGTTVGAARAQTAKRPMVELRTELGTMVVALYNETPVHRDNFLKLVREGAYEGLLIHRVLPGFMLQCGDPASRDAAPDAVLGDGDPGYTLPAEIVPGLIHKRGALAAARMGDPVNPERRSNGMQFYIVDGRTYTADELTRMEARAARAGDTLSYGPAERLAYARDGGVPQLDGAYTVFGEVVTGHEVIAAIAAVRRNADDRPLNDIRTFLRILE